MRNTPLPFLALLSAGLVTARLLRVAAGSAGPMPPVRQSGPEHMDNPPARWGRVDEMSDESFPASDPPAIY